MGAIMHKRISALLDLAASGDTAAIETIHSRLGNPIFTASLFEALATKIPRAKTAHVRGWLHILFSSHPIQFNTKIYQSHNTQTLMQILTDVEHDLAGFEPYSPGFFKQFHELLEKIGDLPSIHLAQLPLMANNYVQAIISNKPFSTTLMKQHIQTPSMRFLLTKLSQCIKKHPGITGKMYARAHKLHTLCQLETTLATLNATLEKVSAALKTYLAEPHPATHKAAFFAAPATRVNPPATLSPASEKPHIWSAP
jgi:hypothetical protein